MRISDFKREIEIVAMHARADGRAEALTDVARLGVVQIGSYDASDGSVAVISASTTAFEDEPPVVVRERWLSDKVPIGDERVLVLRTDYVAGALPLSDSDTLGRPI